MAPSDAQQRPRQPGRIRSIILAVAVHVAFFALIVFGVSWQSRPMPPAQAELWEKLPEGKTAAAAQAEPEPAKPEPAPKPEPPKLEPKPEPPKPDPAIAEKREREKKELERKELEKRELERQEQERKEKERKERERREQEKKELERKEREAKAAAEEGKAGPRRRPRPKQRQKPKPRPRRRRPRKRPFRRVFRRSIDFGGASAIKFGARPTFPIPCGGVRRCRFGSRSCRVARCSTSSS